MISCKFKVAGTKQVLLAYYNALKPEANEGKRASYTVKVSLGKLVVSVSAKDFVAFRAVLTSVLSVMAIVDKTLKAAA
jgi:tRNA threonylcarbamoyladenosine modification (KEOPS) complex  Pcc1 subunit